MKRQFYTGRVSYDFTKKIVIVTGAARGIGRSMVKNFVESGALVVAADRDAEGGGDGPEGLRRAPVGYR